MLTDLDTLITALYVKIDDCLPRSRRLGRPPRLSDAELITLAVAQALLGITSEARWLRIAAARLAGAFPFLLVLADFPLSLIGDTFTLPLTIYMRQNKHPKPDRAVNGTTPGPEVPAKPFWPEVVNIDAPPAAARQATDTRPSGPP